MRVTYISAVEFKRNMSRIGYEQSL